MNNAQRQDVDYRSDRGSHSACSLGRCGCRYRPPFDALSRGSGDPDGVERLEEGAWVAPTCDSCGDLSVCERQTAGLIWRLCGWCRIAFEAMVA